MALTVTKVSDFEEKFAKLKVAVVDVTFDTSYPNNGEGADPVRLAAGLRSEIVGCTCIGGNAAAGGVLIHYDSVNNKLMLFYPTGGGAAAPTTLADPAALASNSGGDTITLAIPITPGIAKQLGNTADASTLTYRLLVWGR